jgi:hypothetical protein
MMPFVVALLAPEWILAWAMQQRIVANQIAEEVNDIMEDSNDVTEDSTEIAEDTNSSVEDAYKILSTGTIFRSK